VSGDVLLEVRRLRLHSVEMIAGLAGSDKHQTGAMPPSENNKSHNRRIQVGSRKQLRGDRDLRFQ
jgi:hypothetical protein